MLKKLGKSLLAMLILVSGFQGFLQIQASETEKPMKLTNVKATAKSSQGHAIEQALDGDKSTYWESPRSTMENVLVEEYKYDHNRYIDITLDGTYDLSQIKIFNKEGSYYNYYIYASVDGDNYERIATKSNTTQATFEGDSIELSATASYLRINMAYNSKEFTTNINELELYGVKRSTKVSEPTPIEVKPFNDSEWATKWDQFVDNEVFAEQKTIREMQAMVTRVIGMQYVDKFVFELRDPFNVTNGKGKDVFELETVNGKIVVRGNDGVSLASGFNYYLKFFCNVDYNPIFTSSKMTLPTTLPSVDEKIIKDTMYDYRYALNFCTYSYSMSFWGWDEYEKFLDWAAMNGINLVLDIVGQEEVLREFLTSYGYSDAEIRDYISGPAYFAWFYMQNLDSVGGPLPADWFEQRTELGRKMHDRMQAFGIDPVIQGFSGMVPYNFAEKSKIPASDVLDVGDWPGYKRPYMLRTHKSGKNEVSDSYKEAAKRFYKAQKDVFGNISDYYAVDPFHEGGIIPEDMNIQHVYNQVQSELFNNNGIDSIWVMQQWQGGINEGKLNGLKDKSKAIVLDLQSDMNEQSSPMEKTNTPWIWNMLHNFGGRMGMDGEVEVIANKIPEAMRNSKNMVGIGITPEAIENSPIVYELLFDMTWEKDPINYKEWTYKYAQRRYNIDANETKVIDDMKEAYDILLNTVYADKTAYIQGAAESVVNSRPGMSFNSASTWGHSTISYDKVELEKAVNLFAEHYEKLKSSPAFVYDLTDLLEQVLSNTAVEYHKLMVKAYDAKNKEEFTKISSHFLGLIKLSDQVLGSTEKFLLGTWLSDARTMLDTETYKMDDWSRDLFEFNARGLVTTWGAQKNGSLKDYSNRKWAGLTSDFYLQRWSIWVNNRIDNLDGKQANDPNWFLWEWQWANRKSDGDSAFTTEVNNFNLNEAAATIMNDYSMTNINSFVSGGAVTQKVNIAIGKPVEANFAPTSGNTGNLVDNNTGSNFIYSKTNDNVIMEMDLNGIAEINEFGLSFNQGAATKPYTYSIEYLDPETSKWVEASRNTSGSLQANVTIEFKCTASKLRYTFKTNDLVNNPLEITELYVYGKMIKETEFINYALNMPVTTPGSPQKPATNVTDGKLDTLWIENGGKFGENTSVTVDLQTSRVIEFIEVAFEKPGLPFQYKVIANPGESNESIILDNSNSMDATPAKVSIPYNKEVKKIKVVMIGKNNAGIVPSAWPAIAEVRALAQKKNDKFDFLVGENVALDKEVTVPSGDLKKQLIVDGIHDGKDNRWERGAGTYPTEITIDLDGTYYIDEVNAGMEAEGYGFKYKLEIINKYGNRILVVDRTMDGEVAGSDKYVHIPVNAMAQKIIYTQTGNGIGTGILAWPCLSEVQAIAGKPNSASKKATITSTGSFTELELKKLIDDNPVTLLDLNASETKEFQISLEKSTDVDMFELIKSESSDNPLQYKVYYKNSANMWIEVIDQSKNSKDKKSNTYILDTVVHAKDFKFIIVNEQVELSDINIFQGVATQPLKSRIENVKAILNSKKIGSYAGNYPQTAANALNVALVEAQAKVDANCNAEEVVVAITNLNEALEVFLVAGPITINRSALTKILSESEVVIVALTKTNNTALLATLNTAYDAAKVINEKTLVTQQELNQATTSLTSVYNTNKAVFEAISSYQGVVSNAEKQIAMTTVGDSDGNVSQERKDALSQAIVQAKESYQTSGNTVATITTIQTTLQEKINEFVSAKVKVNKVQLQAEVIEAAKKQRVTYTTTSWKAFETAYVNANKILVGGAANQTQVDAVKDALKTASTGLKTKGNTEELATMLYMYVSTYDKTMMSEASSTAYDSAIASAQAMLNNSTNTTDEEVSNMKKTLENTVAGLFGNKAKLQAFITEQNALKETEYTPVSWKNLKTAMEKANTLLDHQDIVYAEFVSAYDGLVAAVSTLEKQANKSELNTLVSTIDAAMLIETDYTGETWTTFKSAYEAAKVIIADGNATAQAISDGYSALNSAYTGLVVNLTSLQALIATQSDVKEEDYTTASWLIYAPALQSAKDVVAKEKPTIVEVKKAYNDLEKGIIQLSVIIDAGVIQKVIDGYTAENLKEAEYTKASWQAYQTALISTKELLEILEVRPSELKKSLIDLQKAHDNIVSVIDLQSAITSVSKLVQKTYTTTSWNVVVSAKLNAENLLKSTNVITKETIATEIKALNATITALQKRSDNMALQAYIDELAKDATLIASNYTAASWATYNSAYQGVQEILKNNANVSQEQANTALTTLESAHSALVVQGNIALSTLISKVDAMQPKKELYTSTSWVELDTALLNAKNAIKDVNSTDEKFNEVFKNLNKALDSLILRGIKTNIQKTYDTGSALLNKDYTEVSWKVFDIAFKAAKIVLDNKDATQDMIDASNLTLEQAMNSLVSFNTDKTALQALIKDSSSFKEERYTSATWLVYKPLLEKAIEISKKPKALQEEINIATQNLRTAITQLVKRGDKVELQALISKVEKLNKESYVKSTWDALQSLFKEAKRMQANAEATQADVSSAFTNLSTAIDNLVMRGDKTALQEYMVFVKAITKTDFSSTTWEVFAKAIQQADTVLANVDATSKHVQEALSAMKSAYGQLMKTHKPVDNVIVGGKDIEFVMDAKADVIDPRADLTVQVVDTPEKVESINKAMAKDTSKYIVFDISISLEGVKVQPNGSVNLSLNAPVGYDLTKLKLFYVDDEGIRHEIEYRHEGGRIYFNTTHFSYYAFAEMKEKEPTPTPTPTPTPNPFPNKVENTMKPGITGANTGDTTNEMIWVSMMLLSVACGLVFMKKRKEFM